jgi:hypothetical protein
MASTDEQLAAMDAATGNAAAGADPTANIGKPIMRQS